METPPPLPPTPPPPAMNPPPPPPLPQGSDKLWSILSHLSVFLGVPFVLPLVVYLVMKTESDYVMANAREALNFHISILIYSVCCIPMLFFCLGLPCLLAIWACTIIFSILAAIKASEGGCYHYPLTLRLVQ